MIIGDRDEHSDDDANNDCDLQGNEEHGAGDGACQGDEAVGEGQADMEVELQPRCSQSDESNELTALNSESSPKIPPSSECLTNDTSVNDDDDRDGESEVSVAPKAAKSNSKTHTMKSLSFQGDDTPIHDEDKLAPVPEIIDLLISGPVGSKMILEGALKSVIRGPATMLTQETIPMVEDPFTIKIFSLDPKSEPSNFDFRTHKNVVREIFLNCLAQLTC